jgi:endo-1,4-beta-xylanase
MPPTRRRQLILLLGSICLPLAAPGQMAAGRDKFLGNIVANSVPANFNTYWNQITPENSSKWGSVEGTRNTMNWTALDTAYNHAKANGFKFKLHTLVWGSQYPTWVTALSATDQRAEIEQWMTLLAARYPDVWAVDVVNEPIKTPLPFKAALGGDGTTGWDWVITSFQLARQKFPNAKLLINEYGTENDATARNQMLAIIGLLKERNLIDGIGIQAHAFNLDQMNAAQMQACLDAYAATGLDLYITELDIRGIGTTHTEAAQASKYQELFPTMWQHPGVKGVTLWGYITGQTWMTGSGIVNADGTERAAMVWLKSYMREIATVPNAPSGLTAAAASTAQINLAWADNSSIESAFKVERAASAEGPWTEIAANVPANSTTYSATGLSASTTYYFRVRASNSVGDSGYSATASATTQAPPPPPAPPASGGGGGGGGAPSHYFVAFLVLASLFRFLRRAPYSGFKNTVAGREGGAG